MSTECMIRELSARCISYKGTLAAAINERLIGRYLVPPRAAEWYGSFRFGKSIAVSDAMNVASAEVIFRNGRVTIYLWAGEHDDDPATLAHLPPIEAKVIALPTAAAVAPVQPARRGRYPRNVTHIRCGQELRNAHSTREKLIAAKQTALRCFEGHINTCLAEIAELQARQ